MSPLWRCFQWVSKLNWFTCQNTPFLHFICILSSGCSVVKLDWIRGIQALCLLSCPPKPFPGCLHPNIVIQGNNLISWPPKPLLLMKPFYSWTCFWQLCSQQILCPKPSTLHKKKTLPKLKMLLTLRWKERGMLKNNWRMSRYTAEFLDISTEFHVKLNISFDAVCL